MNSYQSDSIEILQGLEPIKKRPGMYTETSSPTHLLQEILDNSVDEALSGYCKNIEVELFDDGSICVIDDGRGMPVDMHKEQKISGVEVIFSTLHSGAKFSNKEYLFSGGLHGVGVCVVNALCKHLEVEVKRDGKIYQIEFNDGLAKNRLKQVGTCPKNQTGSRVRFWPNEKYFDTIQFHQKNLIKIIKTKAILCPNLNLTFKKEGKVIDFWCFENGILDYLNSQVQENEILPRQIYQLSHKEKDFEIDLVMCWNANKEDKLVQESYANLIPTPLGGTHVSGLRTALLNVVRDFCEMRNLLVKGLVIRSDDILNRLNYCLSIKIKNPQFAGQTKEKLNSNEVSKKVADSVQDAFNLWLNQHVDMGVQIIDLILQDARARANKSKKTARKNPINSLRLPGKLADCQSTEISETELFLVEGDSAGGSAKQARNKEFQAILALRGKILNTWEITGGKLLESQTIKDLITAIGVDINSNDLSSLRYGKICILADADSDGLHIASLLCAFFIKHLPKLVNSGYIYLAMPPLYRLDIGKETFYALNDVEKDEIIKSKTGKINIQRFKGLGEMNASQLKESVIHPKNRRLVQLSILDTSNLHELIDKLLSKKRSHDRKNWLEQKGDLAGVD